VKTSYTERDYSFGQAMLTLRTEIGLTQKGLANLLGVSRRAVGEWEAGNSYPKTEHLKAMIVLAVKCQVFPKGSEASEIRALWKAARQKVLLDEHWLSAQLSTRSESDLATAAEQERAFTRNDTTRDARLLFAQKELSDSIEEFLAWCPPAFPVGMHLLRGLQAYLDTADLQAAISYWEEVLQAEASTRTHIRRIAHSLYQGSTREAYL